MPNKKLIAPNAAAETTPGLDRSLDSWSLMLICLDTAFLQKRKQIS
jgi:hypothetical protein